MEQECIGWSEEAFDLLLRLEGDPSPSVREALRKEQGRLIRAPMVALLDALARADELYQDFSVWSPGRATLWGWQVQSSRISVARNIELGVSFDLDGLRVQGAWWYADAEQIQRFRAAVADDETGAALARILDRLTEQSYDMSGDRLKRPLRGYPTDHPRAELLRHRSLIVGRWLGGDADVGSEEGWVQTPEVVPRVLSALEEMRPLLSWLTETVWSASSDVP